MRNNLQKEIINKFINWAKNTLVLTPEKSRGMESEDKRVNQLTQIASAPADGVLVIDVPGSTAANGITVDNLARTMPVATSKRNGLLDRLDYNSSMFYRGNITKSEVNKRLLPGLYYHGEELNNGTSRYGMLVVLIAEDIQFQFDLCLGGAMFYRMSYGLDAENPTWGSEWTKLI